MYSVLSVDIFHAMKVSRLMTDCFPAKAAEGYEKGDVW